MVLCEIPKFLDTQNISDMARKDADEMANSAKPNKTVHTDHKCKYNLTILAKNLKVEKKKYQYK